jgi:hypothetical protein
VPLYRIWPGMYRASPWQPWASSSDLRARGGVLTASQSAQMAGKRQDRSAILCMQIAGPAIHHHIALGVERWWAALVGSRAASILVVS